MQLLYFNKILLQMSPYVNLSDNQQGISYLKVCTMEFKTKQIKFYILKSSPLQLVEGKGTHF